MMGDAFAEWAAESADLAAAVTARRDADAIMVERALGYVRAALVAATGGAPGDALVLYGGQAIEYALRLKGDAIYPDEARPDYDMYTSKNVEVAYDMADALARAGFRRPRAVRAIHMTTMRVGVDFITVADLTFLPPAVVARIPTLVHERVTLVHPDFQRGDVHLALSFPFRNAPREEIYHRFRKDVARFRKLQEHYPIAPPEGVAPVAVGVVDIAPALALSSARAGEERAALSGYLAYAAIFGEYQRLVARTPGGAPPGLIPLAIDFGAATCEIPRAHAGPPVRVAGPRPLATVAALDGGAAAWYHPYMDRVGRTCVVTGRGRAAVVVESTEDELLSVCEIAGHAVASVQFALLGFHVEMFRAAEPAARDLARAFYVSLLRCLEDAGARYAAAGASAETIMSGPFGISVTTLGGRNESVAHKMFMADLRVRMGELEGEDPRAGAPPSYFPGQRDGRRPFAYAGECRGFRIAGDAE